MDKDLILDQGYQDTVSAAIASAILEASVAEDDTVILRSGEIVMALKFQLAYFLSINEDAATPAKTRQLCRLFADDLFKAIEAMKQQVPAAPRIIMPESATRQ